VSDVYPASLTKRSRTTKSQMEARRAALFRIVQAMKPMTVRQMFYQATVASVIGKTEGGYSKVQTDLVTMRRDGELPYWLADDTRWQRKPFTFTGVQVALEHAAKFYRKALWADSDAYVEISLEKDPLAGVVIPVTSEHDVPSMVARGYASLSFLRDAANGSIP
jgi:hypothetical protein